ncbi:MAG: NAD-dependent epimerase/dehydratase family protein [Bryobacterales bacterium]|jgi:nucleoside-diphosphate-sugar epimerase|nr:NAD-dependent epimerase/dehydratase family protein [Bryobacterales bacterium]
MAKFLILGCGFTGTRVARHLLAAGHGVTVTTRDPSRLSALRRAGATLVGLEVDPACPALPHTISVEEWDAIVYSIPTLRIGESLVDPAPVLMEALCRRSPRAIYLSTTGVYGEQQRIGEHTQPAPRTVREQLRVDAETTVLQSFPSPLVLRPAAIYGPFRGVHASMRVGKYRLTGEGDNYISRIYVEDLAKHVLAALTVPLTGAWAVADALPCTQREMASYCAQRLGLPMPPSLPAEQNAESLRADRRVDGSAVRAALGIDLAYPTYREGVEAALAEEAASGAAVQKLSL